MFPFFISGFQIRRAMWSALQLEKEKSVSRAEKAPLSLSAETRCSNSIHSLASKVTTPTGVDCLQPARLQAKHLVPDCPNNPRDWVAALTLQRGMGKVGEVESFSKSQRMVVLGLK